MRFSWDPEKSDANFQDRGFDFGFASLIFDGPTLERKDTGRDYGERRIIAIGLAAGLELTVCYTDRVDASGVFDRRIISARRSNRRDAILEKALDKVVRTKEYNDFMNAGPFGILWSPAAEFGKFMAEQDATMGVLMKEAGVAK